MNGHLNDGELRAFLDDEMAIPFHERAAAHLSSCSHCRQRAEVLAAQMGRIHERLAALSPLAEESPAPAGAAYVKWKHRILQKEKPSMMKNIFAPRYRLALAAMLIVAILSLAMAFPGVRALANDFLGIFRIQRFTVVQFNPEDVPERLGHSTQFEYILSEDVQFEQMGENQVVSTVAEASALAGFAVRLPTAVEGALHLEVQPGLHASLTINLPRVRSLLAEIGRSDIVLPDAMDGATVTLDLPTAVIASYGDCEFEAQEVQETEFDPQATLPVFNPCTTLVQVPSPTISAPPDLDFNQVGEAFLQVLGMSPEEAEHFSQRMNWTTTLVVPIPRYSATHQDVRVDGVEGVLIRQTRDPIQGEYLMMWVNDGIVYALMGTGSPSTALSIGNSLK